MKRAIAILWLASCDGSSAHDAGRDASDREDAGAMVDAFVPPDARMPDAGDDCNPGSTLDSFCRGDADCNDLCFCNGTERCQGGRCVSGRLACDDGIECTIESCDESRFECDREPDDAACDDANPCTGEEICDVEVGCLPGLPMNCSDGISCTIDSCDPVELCQNPLRDLDRDGFADARCEGGVDCDDDPITGGAVHPGAIEICHNTVDDDCNGVADVFDTDVCSPTNDACASALMIAGSGTYHFSTDGLRDDYALSCESSSGTRPDAIFRFTTVAVRDVTIELVGSATDSTVALVALADCSRVGSESIACDRDTSGSSDSARIEARDLEAGEYAIVIAVPEEGLHSFDLTIESPAIAPSNDVCDDMTPIITGSASFSGDFELLADDYSDVGCGELATPAPEAAYLLSLVAPMDVHIEATAVNALGASRDLAVAIVHECADPIATSLGCAQSELARAAALDVPALDAGEYWILVEYDDVAGAATFDLSVDLSTPAPPPMADRCESAVDATDRTATVPIAPLRNDGGLGCGGSGVMYRDAFFSFEVAVPSDVTVTTSAPVFHLFSVTLDCSSPGAELVCQSSSAAGVGSVSLFSLTPGTYYVGIAIATDAGDLSVTTAVSPL